MLSFGHGMAAADMSYQRVGGILKSHLATDGFWEKENRFPLMDRYR